MRKITLIPATNANMVEYMQTGEDDNSAIAIAIRQLSTNHLFTIADSAIHDPLRTLVTRMFIPKQLAEWRPVAERATARIIDEMCGAGEVDFIAKCAEELPLQLLGTILAMESQEIAAVRRAVHKINDMYFLEPTPDQMTSTNSGIRDYVALVSEVVRRAARKGGEENAWIVNARMAFDNLALEGKPNDFDVFLAINLFDAFHTNALVGTNAAFMLLSNPEALDQLRRDPSLVPAAVLEGIRLLPPAPYTDRYVTEDFEFDGTLIPKGAVLRMMWAAGNRDPEAFPAPDRFDMTRKVTAEHSFGGGARMCPGRMFGRFVIEALFRQLIARGLEVSLADRDYLLRKNFALFQIDSMPITIDRRP